MKEVTLDELKARQISILEYVSAFCKKNNINYWLDNGTLLGAIRHKGYIPWDDDIDIGMLRDDYDRFSRIFNNTTSKYYFNSIEVDSSFPYSSGKVIDKESLLIEPNGIRIGINIDVFVYDNAPDNDKKVKQQYDRRDLFRQLAGIKHRENLSRNFLKTIAILILKGVFLFLPECYFEKKIMDNSKRFNCKQTERVGNFTSYTRISCSKKIFTSFIDVEFEGKKYSAPIGYDQWLKAFYGNYMELPPIEKRKTHHTFNAYVED